MTTVLDSTSFEQGAKLESKRTCLKARGQTF